MKITKYNAVTVEACYRIMVRRAADVSDDHLPGNMFFQRNMDGGKYVLFVPESLVSSTDEIRDPMLLDFFGTFKNAEWRPLSGV